MPISRDEPLALNAVGSVVIRGLVKTQDGKKVSVQATRCKPPPLLAVHENHLYVRPDGFPPRVPDNLPGPQDFRLELCIRKELSSGRCGRVFLTSAMSLSDPSDPSDVMLSPAPPVLPQLVVKVARPKYTESLSREAAAYHEMQAIQGVSIARCYGWFEAELDQDHLLYDDGESDDSDNDSSSNVHAASQSKAPQTNKVSFLVLERLGSKLEMFVNYAEDADMYEVYEDLGFMGVDHADVRYANILKRPKLKSSRALPTLKCPYHNVVHHYRVVDFDRATKTDFTMRGYNARTATDLGMLFEGIAHGGIIEPW
ncbi:hypothetical protein A0H81_02063 [Grifola frondosa]|uniref:Protein kinase domain-containing protein n=1 Tax=Grifola frondosa TaxID=5627 RepID=A0A1C7MLI7_GRIFR|nr:hypothetical protein A0H81_02063 [Grifola frondosa]